MVLKKHQRQSVREADERISTPNSIFEQNLLKKEVQKIYNTLTLRLRKKAKPQTTIQEEVEEENIYENCAKSNILTQPGNVFDDRKSVWRKSLRRMKNRKPEERVEVEVEHEEETEGKFSTYFSRSTLRRTCANTRRSFKKLNMKNRRKSVAVPEDSSIWTDSITDDSGVTFEQKVQKLKRVFKDGLKVFKKQQVTEL